MGVGDGVTWSEDDRSPFADATVDAITSTDDGRALVAGHTGSYKAGTDLVL